MKKILFALVVVLSTNIFVSQEVNASTKVFDSCASLRKVYPRGVAITKAKSKNTRANVSRAAYGRNKKLDTNNNGIACEKGEKRLSVTQPVQTPVSPSVVINSPITSPAPVITPAPTTTITPVTVPPIGKSRTTPHPYGSVVTRPGGWAIQVLSTTPNATSIVLAENMFNDPPGAGGQFFMARVRLTFVGAGSDSFSSGLRLRAVGSAGNSYTSFSDRCGVIPNPVSSNRVFTGGSIEGNVCWAVSNADAQSLVMFDEYWSYPVDLGFFALR